MFLQADPLCLVDLARVWHETSLENSPWKSDVSTGNSRSPGPGLRDQLQHQLASPQAPLADIQVQLVCFSVLTGVSELTGLILGFNLLCIALSRSKSEWMRGAKCRNFPELGIRRLTFLPCMLCSFPGHWLILESFHLPLIQGEKQLLLWDNRSGRETYWESEHSL